MIEALKAGYEAQFVTDAVGSRSEIAHRTGIERLSLAGAVANTALGVVCEWFRDWAGPLAEPAREAVVWYLAQVPKVTDRVGITEAEAARAQAALAGRCPPSKGKVCVTTGTGGSMGRAPTPRLLPVRALPSSSTATAASTRRTPPSS